MDVKARSKAMREILTRIVERTRGAVEVKMFGDKVILDEGACLLGSSRESVLIDFFSTMTYRREELASLRCAHLILFDRFPST